MARPRSGQASVLIAGPTASGKSALALALAKSSAADHQCQFHAGLSRSANHHGAADAGGGGAACRTASMAMSMLRIVTRPVAGVSMGRGFARGAKRWAAADRGGGQRDSISRRSRTGSRPFPQARGNAIARPQHGCKRKGLPRSMPSCASAILRSRAAYAGRPRPHHARARSDLATGRSLSDWQRDGMIARSRWAQRRAHLPPSGPQRTLCADQCTVRRNACRRRTRGSTRVALAQSRSGVACHEGARSSVADPLSRMRYRFGYCCGSGNARYATLHQAPNDLVSPPVAGLGLALTGTRKRCGL